MIQPTLYSRFWGVAEVLGRKVLGRSPLDRPPIALEVGAKIQNSPSFLTLFNIKMGIKGDAPPSRQNRVSDRSCRFGLVDLVL
ncbi:hypothetical protein [Prochlorothrix hollandica]|uniref:hypothetical protein n=1 Tax=Prochlorothrix hollandica TaxID=1223 RepID=UPI00333FD79A